MSKTATSVSMLQAVAVIAGLAVLLWSLGLPSLRFADAANLTNVSDTLSDSAPNVAANHTIAFTLPAGGTPIGPGDSITITFPDGTSDFDLSSIDAGDMDLATSSDYALQDGAASGATWGVSTSTFAITFTSGTETIATGTAVTIEVGTNATFGGTGNGQIVNPASSSYEINISTNEGDQGATRVVILDNVQVTASVDTTFSFTVAGVGAGQSVNGSSTSGTTTATTIPFGQLEAGTPSTTAQDLTVTTNASQGYSVTVQVDQTLLSSTGADIDLFEDSDTPTAWTAPSATIGDENTYGYWGVTSEDATTSRSTEFGTGEYIGASTTPRIVMGADGPADGTTQGVGTARVGYRAEITALQEAGDDYEATLTYVATPVF